MKYQTQLLRKETVAEGTMAFYFTKPENFFFRAGQNADYTIPHPKEMDSEGNKRTFSFASAPDEKEIMWATRMRDTAFKRNMRDLEIGTELEMEGPYGDMVLHSRSEKLAVFLAGGIGITPFHSIIKDATQKQLPHKIFLFYSNRRPEDAPFFQELVELEKLNPNFKLIATMTDAAKSSQPWNGETGYITSEMIKKYVGENLDGPIFYLAGPPAMTAAMHEMLVRADVNFDDIRSEEFSGY